MKICVKTKGDALHTSLLNICNTQFQTPVSKILGNELTWQVVKLPVKFDITDLVCQQNTPSVIIADADDSLLLRSIQASQSSIQHLISTSRHPQLVRCPVIIVFRDASALAQSQHLPEFAGDWILASSLATEALPRIMGTLKKAQISLAALSHAALTLVPATRTMIYDSTSARLTPAEYTLLELFLSNIGSIISLQELVLIFRASGKSAEANNIRVAIYQLRLKLDTLTKSQMPLTSVYRQGYCLRQKLKSAAMHIPIPADGNFYNIQNDG